MTKHIIEHDINHEEEEPTIEADRIAPGITFEQILLEHIQRCGKAYSYNMEVFPMCVEALRLINSPRLSKTQRKALNKEISDMKKDTCKEYEQTILDRFNRLMEDHKWFCNYMVKTYTKHREGYVKSCNEYVKERERKGLRVPLNDDHLSLRDHMVDSCEQTIEKYEKDRDKYDDEYERKKLRGDCEKAFYPQRDWSIARRKYEILLTTGKLDKFFKIATEKQAL
jgi:hypothetical protein